MVNALKKSSKFGGVEGPLVAQLSTVTDFPKPLF